MGENRNMFCICIWDSAGSPQQAVQSSLCWDMAVRVLSQQTARRSPHQQSSPAKDTDDVDGPSLFLSAVTGIEMFLNWQVLKFIPLCLQLLEVQDALSHVLDISFVVQKFIFT